MAREAINVVTIEASVDINVINVDPFLKKNLYIKIYFIQKSTNLSFLIVCESGQMMKMIKKM